jgi:hypothetical protein
MREEPLQHLLMALAFLFTEPSVGNTRVHRTTRLCVSKRVHDPANRMCARAAPVLLLPLYLASTQRAVKYMASTFLPIVFPAFLQ